MIQAISGTGNFDEVTAKGNAVVMFSAPWCGYCRRLHPMVEKVSGEIFIPIYEVNCDDDKELAERFEVEIIPTLIFFRDGKELDRIIGGGDVGYPELVKFIEKNTK